MASDTYNQGVSNVQGANQTGQNAINSFDPSNYANTTMSGLNTIIGGQNNTQNDYQKAFINTISNNPTATQYYRQGQQIYNVQPLQEQANRLTNAVLTAPINDVNAAKGFNYDSNQVAQKQNQDLMYLSPQANAAQNNATTAQNNATTYMNAGLEQTGINLLPIEQQGNYLMQQYAAQQTGWTTAQAQQLSALQAKMQAGAQLSATEMQQYAALTQSEQSYQAALASANATVQSAQIGNNYKILSPSQGLYDASTGKITPYATNSKVPQNGLQY
ncbi:MAG TPA: hypothetical protein VF941_03145 [Clostridia bacterium]